MSQSIILFLFFFFFLIDDHTCRLWDLETGKQKSCIPLSSAGMGVKWHHKEPNKVLSNIHNVMLQLYIWDCVLLLVLTVYINFSWIKVAAAFSRLLFLVNNPMLLCLMFTAHGCSEEWTHQVLWPIKSTAHYVP